VWDNNENDVNMCYVKFEPETGFFHMDGKGYVVEFIERSTKEIPFASDMEMS